MKAFYKWLNQMKKRNIDVAINSGWWFSRSKIYTPEEYAKWVSEAVRQIVIVHGFTNVKYMHLFTEPNSLVKYMGDYVPEYTTYCRAIHEQLIADGNRDLIKLVGPNSCWHTWVPECTKQLNDVIDIYSDHVYYNGDSLTTYNYYTTYLKESLDAVKKTGKQFWSDEYGIQIESYRETSDYGNFLGQANAAFLNSGLQNSFLWLLFDQLYTDPLNHTTNKDSFYDGLHKFGLLPWFSKDRTPRPAFYAFDMMSRYLGGSGTEVLKTKSTDNVFISATRQPTGTVSFLVVNNDRHSNTFTISFSEKIAGNVYRYVYNPETINPSKDFITIQSDKSFKNLGVTLTDTIPSRAVVIYTTIPTEKSKNKSN